MMTDFTIANKNNTEKKHGEERNLKFYKLL